MKFSKRLVYALVNNVFLAFTLMVFGPYEIFISNMNDFTFSFRDFWWMLVCVALVYVLAATTVIAILPWKIGRICVNLVFVFTFCSYVQAMFLNGKMRVMVGQMINWPRSTLIGNLLLWFAICVVFFLLLYLAPKYWNGLLLFLPGALIAMQTVALVFLLLTTDALRGERGGDTAINGYVSDEAMFDLSANKNVIVFLLDCFDGRTMDAILEQQPDILEPLEGFTYFPNATSVYSRTYPSVPYLLSGNMCYFDQKPAEWVNGAFADSNFIPELVDAQVNIGLYTYDYYLGNSIKDKVENYIVTEEADGLLFDKTVLSMAKMILYRDMPYLMKKRLTYDINEINYIVTEGAAGSSQEKERISQYKNFDDEWFDTELKERGITLTDAEGVFRFYHLGSCHLDMSNPEPYGIRSLEIVYEYLDKMKELGIYDDSMVLIISDHGSSGGGATLDLPQKTAVPIFMVKPANAAPEALRVSEAPVSHTDFIPTVLNGFQIDHTDYGRTVFEISEQEDRDRYYYYSALYSDEQGEVELREYKVSGDAADSGSYRFTGNTWKIIYSRNMVAD